jgi:hypothetical protein
MIKKNKFLMFTILFFFSFNSFAKIICFTNHKYKRITIDIYVSDEYIGSTSIASGKENCIEFGDREYDIKYKVKGDTYGGKKSVYGESVDIF